MPDQTPPDAASVVSLADSLSKLASAQSLVSQEINRMVEGVAAVSERLEKVIGGMEDLLDVSTKVRKEVGITEKGAEGFVNQVESMRGVMRDLMTAISKMRLNLKSNTATIDDTKKAYEGVLKILKNVYETSKKNSQQQISARDAIASTEEMLRRINAEQAKGNSKLKDHAKLVEDIKKNMERIELTGGKLAGVFDKFGLGKVSRTILDLNSALDRSGRLESAIRKGEQRYNTKEEIRSRRRESGQILEPRNAKEGFLPTRGENGRMEKSYFKKRGVTKDLLDETGTGFDVEQLAKIQGEEGEKIRQSVMDFYFNPEHGGTHQAGLSGWLNRRLAKKALKAGNAGEFSEALEGGGLMQHGLGTLSKFAAPIGLVSMVGGAIKDGWDMMAEQNKKYEAALGKSGIFAGREGGLTALTNVKENLRAWGINKLGITSERNLAIAQAMQESGLGLSGLATRQSHGFGYAMGEGAGTWGGNWGGTQQIAMTAMVQARSLGLTDVEGVQQTLKMMQQYKMSLEGTQKFFGTVGEDMRSAGISTTKYLQLIDEISGQFDNMAKSINVVVGTLRILGNAGTNTYDQLKDNMTALFGTQEKTTEQSMYLYQQMKNSGSFRGYTGVQESLAEQATENFKQIVTEATKDLPGKNEDLLKAVGGLSRNATVEQMDSIREMFESRKSELNVKGTPLTQLIGGALQQATNARLRAGALETQNPIVASFAEENLPIDPLSKMIKNYAAFDKALKDSGIKGGMGEFMKSPTGTLQHEQTGIISRAGAAYGLSQDDVKHILNTRAALIGISDAVVDTIQKAATESQVNPENFKNKHGGTFDQLFGDTAKQLLGSRYDKNKSLAEQFQNLNIKDLASIKKIAQGNFNYNKLADLHKSSNNINQFLTEDNLQTISSQIDNIAGLASATRTSQDLLAGIKDALVNKISGLLLGIFTQGKGKDSRALADAIVDATDSTVEANQNMADQIGDLEKNYNKKIIDPRIAQYGFNTDPRKGAVYGIEDIAQGYRDRYQKLMDDQSSNQVGNKQKDEDAASYERYKQAMRTIISDVTDPKKPLAEQLKNLLGVGFDSNTWGLTAVTNYNQQVNQYGGQQSSIPLAPPSGGGRSGEQKPAVAAPAGTPPTQPSTHMKPISKGQYQYVP